MGKGMIRVLVLSFLSLMLPSTASAAGEKILVFKDSIAYIGHRGGISAAMAKLRGWQSEHAFTIDTTTTFESFNSANLAQYDAVILMYPERANASNPNVGYSDTMSAEQASAFQSWVLTGKGYVGVHCDTRQNANWPWWYQTFVGSKYIGDVGPVSSTYLVADPDDPLTQGMPLSFTANEQIRVDSVFFTEADTNFKVLVRGHIGDYVRYNTPQNQILSPWADTNTVVSWMPFFPFVYRHNYQGARMFHIAPGHNATTWTSPTSNWNNLLLNGVLYALNRPGYGGTTSIAKGPALTGFALERVKNGKNQSLRFGIPKREHVVIQVFNLKGRMIAKLADRNYNAGSYSVALPAGTHGSVSIIDFKAGNYHKALKIVR